MRKTTVLCLLAVMLTFTACGGGIKNDTPTVAAETFMKALIEGDREVVDELNHSDPYFSSTDAIITFANERGIADLDFEELEFRVDEKRERRVFVAKKGSEEENWIFRLDFNDEKDSYYLGDIRH